METSNLHNGRLKGATQAGSCRNQGHAFRAGRSAELLARRHTDRRYIFRCKTWRPRAHTLSGEAVLATALSRAVNGWVTALTLFAASRLREELSYRWKRGESLCILSISGTQRRCTMPLSAGMRRSLRIYSSTALDASSGCVPRLLPL